MLLAGLVERLFAVSAEIALMLFAGLILGTIPDMMISSARHTEKKSWSPLIVSLALSYIFFQLVKSGVGTSIQATGGWYLFCGLVWGLSLVIPGLSSSSILIYMGLYEPMTAGIASLDFGVIIPLLGGLLATVALTARGVNQMIELHYGLFSRIIIGIMLASTLMILPSDYGSILSGAFSIVCFAAGFLVARGMDIAKLKFAEKE
ncbi:MAG: DUF368 domain-containing protein [Lachnospiraceae bacterium]|nr:DUF368 domain-containing protein [Lachnospiraceae bacterium]